ncbi:MAG: dTDP-4-amino-4,6-dideoxygalactose transaminase [Planctomycetaceae bacterium]|nr:dTDP-4-amino-4,6-dideoxygalactose transaminase [Planctomycetaceae bacterium]
MDAENNKTMIPFNKPFVAGKELYYIAQAVTMGNLGGDGHFTKKCAELMQDRFGINKILMTPSCTASLEMAAQLCDVGPGDEVIMPSYTFVSTASAFVRMGAKPVFVDIRPDTLNIDETLIEDAITERTKAICVVHYAGVACEMDRIMAIAKGNNLKVVEDAAQGVNSWYNGRALGSIGDLGCYSFHETKNYICGEGGALCINNPDMIQRAEIIRDKGTNRQRFFRGEVDKYTWVEVGSSYVPSEICSAFLYAQLEEMDRISERRREIYQAYRRALKPLEAEGLLQLPVIPEDCQSNYHLFYAILPTNPHRDQTLDAMKGAGVGSVFHYVPLHSSPKGRELIGDLTLPITEDLSSRLIRLPFYFGMEEECVNKVISAMIEACRRQSGAQLLNVNN